MKQYQKTLHKEYNELLKRLNSLKKFITENPLFPKLNATEQEQINTQASLMQKYSEILQDRISKFK